MSSTGPTVLWISLNSTGEYLGELKGVTLNQPIGIAVDQATGQVYVGDPSNGVVDLFNSSGIYKKQLTGAGIPTGGFLNGTGEYDSITVDGKTGDVFVLSADKNTIYVFDSTGKYLTTWTGANTPAQGFGTSGREPVTMGVAANDTNGDVFVADSTHRAIDVFDATVPATETYLDQIKETPGGPFTFNDPVSISIDQPNGNEYILDSANETIYAFGPGVVVPTLAAGLPSNVHSTEATLSGTIDPEEILITGCQFEIIDDTAYQTALAAHAPNPYSAGASVTCATKAGTPIGSGDSPVAVTANATDLTPGTVYHYRLHATNTNGEENSADQRLISSPVLEGQSVTSLTQSVATLSAKIQPGEVATTYRFAYGTSSEYGSSIPTPEASLSLHEQDTISQTLTGLKAGTTYHYAVVVSSAAGTFTGPDHTFTTAGIPAPSVTTGGPSGVGVSTATLSGTIDPHGWDTTYEFQYGTSTAYGSSWPTVPVDMGALEGPQPVTIELQNLLPGTVYHYRLVAENRGGGTTYGPDMTFTTGEYPASVIQEAPISTASFGFFNPEAEAKESKTKSLTNAQKLANALKACRKKPKKLRASCEKQARKRYGTKTRKKK
jgi:hypothetical protein